MKSLASITRLYSVIDSALHCSNSSLDYDRTIDAIILLADSIADYDDDNEAFCYEIAELITGAYWHFTEWHSGQESKSYLALCALGRIFEPGMTAPEVDNQDYQALNAMAEIELNEICANRGE